LTGSLIIEAETSNWIFRTSVRLISYSGELCSKNRIAKKSETLGVII